MTRLSSLLVAVPVLAIAGSIVEKPRVPPSLGMLPNNHPVFVGTIVVVGILSEAAAVVMTLPVRRRCSAAAQRSWNSSSRRRLLH